MLSRCLAAMTFALACLSVAHADAPAPYAYVLPDGQAPTPEQAASNDHFTSLPEALAWIRAQRGTGTLDTPATIELLGTTHLQEPLTLGPEDSHLKITGGSIHGGRPVSGWQVEGTRWVEEISEAKNRAWNVGALWVNGERRTVARTPNKGDYFYMAGAAPPMPGVDGGAPQDFPKQALSFAPGDIRTWERMDDVLVWVAQAWAFSAHRVARIDSETNSVLFTRPAFWEFNRWTPRARFFVENHLEGLDAPGEWYLDRDAGRLYYQPMPGETPENVKAVLPVARQLLLVKGTAEKPVSNLRLEDVRFEYADWPIDEAGYVDPQAAHTIPGTLVFEWTHDSVLQGCTIAHTGGYALALGDGCRGNRVEQCEAYDLGAGGFRVGATTPPSGSEQGGPHVPTENQFENNFLHHGGRIYPEGVGVWIGHANHTVVRHNDISNFYYTGISNGWVWGYGENPAHHNLIEFNHIHRIGQGVLSDMGGIYNLGIQPGTELRGNHIHDIRSYDYGGWGLYTDEGSSQMLLEANLVHDTTSGSFHQHYGRENIVRNNIFVIARDELLMASRVEDHLSFTFEKNICVVDDSRVTNENWTKARIDSHHNLFWNTRGDALRFWKTPFAKWQAAGKEEGSIVADPGFADIAARDFRLPEDSPAFSIGFEPFDYSIAGLTGDEAWRAKPAGLAHDPVEEKRVPQAAALPQARPVIDDFEVTAVNSAPKGGRIYGAYPPAAVVVSDLAARSGARSLRFLDDPATPAPWEPELAYDLFFREGTLVSRFDLLFTRGALLRYDLRQGPGVECVGPSVVVDQSGGLRVNDTLLTTLPMQTWCRLELRCGLGAIADRRFDLGLRLPNRPQQWYRDLPVQCADFDTAERAHFLAFSNLPVSFYIDDLVLTTE